MRILFLIFIFLNIIHASQIATIEKIVGKVKVLKANELRATKATLNQKLFEDDLLITYSNSMTTIKLDDKSFITLDQKTKLRIVDMKKLKQEEGQVFYNIETQGKNRVEVATNFATIGVKGTKFLINDTIDKKDVSLKTGLIGVSSLSGEFEIHKKKKKTLSEYEQYKLAHEYDFEKYKIKINEEFIEYKKEFELKPHYTISFNKNVVNENKTEQHIKKEFKRFETFQK
ncbi:MAG: FecR family protein [Arcobacteraceae bacterium]